MDIRKTALITGSNRGIGRAILENFAANGITIIAHARKESPEFTNDINTLSEMYGVSITPVFFDMRETETMKVKISEWIKKGLPIDILVNNVGIAHGGLFQMTSMTSLKDVFNVNLFAAMELTQIVLRVMTRQKSGSIINISSIAGIDLKAGNCAYGVSKAAMIAFTKTLAAEVAPLGIRVNAVAPGLTKTDMADLMEEKAATLMKQASGMGRLADPDEIADVVYFLASNHASFVNGQVIRIDGGSV